MQPREHYDVLIIGGGSAGAVTAARLSEHRSLTVGLIEAGPDFVSVDALPDEVKLAASTGTDIHASGLAWAFPAAATRTGTGVVLRPGRVTGGGSAVNATAYCRAIPEDFEQWTKAGLPGWTYDDVLPYYRKTETDADFTNEWHGADGPIHVRRFPASELYEVQRAFRAACLERGFPDCPDDAVPGSSGVGPYAFNSVDGIRQSTAITYLTDARSRPNLHIIDQTTARRLLLDGEEVVGVEVEHEGDQRLLRADRFVLASGAIMTPKLLMLSGVGPADELTALGIDVRLDRPGVGANLADHPLVQLRWRAFDHARPPADAPALQLVLRYTATGSSDRNDIKIYMRNRLLFADGDTVAPVGMLASLDLPTSTGAMHLISADPADLPRIDLNMLDTDSDVTRLSEAVRVGVELGSGAAFTDLLCARLSPGDEVLSSDRDLADWLQANVGTTNHPSGTCAMGPVSNGMAVVDGTLRMHGLRNAWVADASVFPTIPRANLNATAVMIGERAADFVTGA